MFWLYALDGFYSLYFTGPEQRHGLFMNFSLSLTLLFGQILQVQAFDKNGND